MTLFVPKEKSEGEGQGTGFVELVLAMSLEEIRSIDASNSKEASERSRVGLGGERSKLGSEILAFVERNTDQTPDVLPRASWDQFRDTHLSTADDGRLDELFGPHANELEESLELFFMDLASSAETCAGDLYDEEIHENFYLAAREVIAQGTRAQLEFLRDNLPSQYGSFLRKVGLRFMLKRSEQADRN